MIHYTDSHAHLTSDQLFPDIEEIIKRAKDAGVTRIINICTDPESLKRGLEVQKRHPEIYLTAATTPHDVATEGELFFPLVEKASKEGSLAAIGETGLDYFYEHSPRSLQKDFLKRYLALALEKSLPVVIHCRDAFQDFFDIIDQHYPGGEGVLHCFTGTLDEAKEVIKRGFYLSLSGIVTYKKSELLRTVAAWVPLDKLLIETDAPYLAPESLRGKQNEPAYLPETARLIAQIKKISIEELSSFTRSNANSLIKASK